MRMPILFTRRVTMQRQTEGWTDAVDVIVRRVMWSSCPHMDPVNRAACQNDHTWALSLYLVSHPPTHTHTHAHILSGTDKHKRGWA